MKKKMSVKELTKKMLRIEKSLHKETNKRQLNYLVITKKHPWYKWICKVLKWND